MLLDGLGGTGAAEALVEVGGNPLVFDFGAGDVDYEEEHLAVNVGCGETG